MDSLDVHTARMDALVSAVQDLSPVVAAIRSQHGDHIARLALKAALDDCSLALARRPVPRPRLVDARLPMGGETE